MSAPESAPASRQRRIRRVLWLSLSLLTVVTIAAGAAVVHLLPGRAAMWRLPSVRAGQLAGAGQVLGPADDPAAGQAATSAGVTAAVSGLLGSPVLGRHVGGLVTDLATGQVLFSRQPATGYEPASTAKLATAAAALHVLGPGHRLTTTVVAGPAPAGPAPAPVILVGGGDPTLAAGTPPVTAYPQPASLAALAAGTARALAAKGISSVTLGYDTSRYTGPQMGPGWTAGYVSTGNVTPIQSLEVDEGRLAPGNVPDDLNAGGRRSADPAADAVHAFASQLGRDGITVSGPAVARSAPAGARVLASVSSPPLEQIVGQMLATSDNVIAENLARQVAIATGRPASFAGAAAAVTAADAQLGVSRGVQMTDGSGLSPEDRITPDALVRLIRLASAADQTALRSMITGLPVGGFSGTLGPGGSVFGALGQPAYGTVRAKTGNLTTVVALAGTAYARNGQLLAFAFMADQLPSGGLVPGADQLTRLATALAACGCR